MRVSFSPTIVSLLVATSLSAQSPLIYSNGPIITEPGGPPFLSRLQSSPPPAGLQLNVLGFGAQQGAGNALADDFSVCGAMLIDGIEIFGYATGSPTSPSPVTGAFVTILDKDPADPTAAPVPGSPLLATNQIANTVHGWSNIYRVTTTTMTATNRPVMSMRVNINPPIALTAGRYWLAYQFTGVNFCPPISVLGASDTGNAKQRVGAAGAWNNLVDTGFPALPVPAPCGVPFNLYGLSGNAPGSIANTGLASCGPTTIRVGGAPNIGGFIQTDLGGVTGVGIIGFGFLQLGAPFCGCIIGHNWSILVPNVTSVRLAVPFDGSLCGLQVFAQGADALGQGGCPNPAITFTETWRVTLQN